MNAVAPTGALSLELATVPTAPSDARLHTRRSLGGWGVVVDDADAVELVVSELTTNAVRHGSAWNAPPCDESADAVRIVLSLRLVGSDVLVQVFDRSPLPPCLIESSPLAERGRGLHLVAALSTDWGAAPLVEAGGQVGKIVWARVAVRTAPGAAASR